MCFALVPFNHVLQHEHMSTASCYTGDVQARLWQQHRSNDHWQQQRLNTARIIRLHSQGASGSSAATAGSGASSRGNCCID
jgi:hypothetical protein